MRECAICGEGAKSLQTSVLRDGDGRIFEICPACKMLLDQHSQSKNPTERHKAKTYLYRRLAKSPDKEAVRYIRDLIGPASGGARDAADDPLEAGTLVGDFWMTGLRIMAWVYFAAAIAAGIYLGAVYAAGNGDFAVCVFIVIGAVIAAFLGVGLIMVFLHIAEDISNIRYEPMRRK